jgi:uncharacterized membrane protein (DUF2068 family)
VQHVERPTGLRLIIAYKVVKAPLALLLALYLTWKTPSALHVSRVLAHELSEGGAVLVKLALWLEKYVTPRALSRVAAVAWLDGALTAIEAFLLWRGHALGEWVVVVGLALLLPFEVAALAHRPSAIRAVVLLLNAGIVLYLAARRWAAHRERSAR